MPRKYEKVQELLPIIQERLKEGKTQRKIAEEYGLKDKYVVKELIDDYIYFYNHQRIQTKTKLTPLEKRRQSVA